MREQVNDLSWMIGGAQGSGVDSSANTFAWTCASAGLYTYGKREFHSNIKGAHSYFQVRVSDRLVRSHVDEVHMLATFDRETAMLHKHEVVQGGTIIYDPAVATEEELARQNVLLVPLEYDAIIKQVAQQFNKMDQLGKLSIMKNVISVGAALGLLRLDFDYFAQALKNIFSGRRAKLAPMNVAAGKISYEFARERYSEKYGYRLKAVSVPQGTRRVIVNGTQATAIGKLLAGCRFQTYYPITPASDESEFLEAHPEYGIVVVQSEDEVAAVTMITGAALTGVRASTSTSGPGFSLMAEGMGWAGMNEVPIVIFDYQRGGPATGLPTRHEQADLRFALAGAHGEFPRIILSPGDLLECFWLSVDAFNWAEQYQMPVIVLADKSQANSTQALDWFDTSDLRIERGFVVTEEELAKTAQDLRQYKRFMFTESGVSPRPLLGTRGGIFWNSGDEHDEYGHVYEESNNRTKMLDKRMRKVETAEREIPLEKKVSLYRQGKAVPLNGSARRNGKSEADVTLVSWGSTKGAILDAMDVLDREGIHVDFLQIRVIHPLAVEFVSDFLNQAKRKVMVEMNYSGQLEEVVRARTGIAMDHSIRKWNGRPISRDEIVSAIKEILNKKTRKVVLHYGV